MKKIFRLLPVFEQSMSALFNFLLIFLTSIYLVTSDFVVLNNIYLYIMLMVNIMNAIVYQPLMLNFRDTGRIYNGFIIKLVIGHLLLITLMFIIFSYFQGVETPVLILAATLASLIVIYELFRRLTMLQNSWTVITCTGFMNNLVSWLILLSINEISITKVLIIISCSYLLTCFVLLFFLLRNYTKYNFTYKNKPVRSQGWFLLGGAVSFWFISGGYLLLLTTIITNEDTVFLRVIQNLLSGILIILTAFDNFILSSKNIPLTKSKYKLYMLLFIIFYGTIAYFIINTFYTFESVLFTLIIWLFFYYVLSLSKIDMSILKAKGITSIIFKSQFVASAVFALLLHIWHYCSYDLNPIYISATWLLCGCVMWLMVKVTNGKAIKEKN
jgi:hypothetical protein